MDHDLYLPRSRADVEAVTAIVDRAAGEDESLDLMALSMDLYTVHNTVGLRLMDLVGADRLNFVHDVFGIRRHLNRETGQLEDCFVPRFAAREDA
jgi:hypothetical protein